MGVIWTSIVVYPCPWLMIMLAITRFPEYLVAMMALLENTHQSHHLLISWSKYRSRMVLVYKKRPWELCAQFIVTGWVPSTLSSPWWGNKHLGMKWSDPDYIHCCSCSWSWLRLGVFLAYMTFKYIVAQSEWTIPFAYRLFAIPFKQSLHSIGRMPFADVVTLPTFERSDSF